ncbi:MAG: hypothetical protein GY794_16760, partial [bacterium]|nr:hypothetical protein [bacterium]
GNGILQKIATATGVSPRTLMAISGESVTAAVTRQERELLSAFRNLDPVLQARAAGFIFGLSAGGGTDESAMLGADLSSGLASAEANRQTEINQPKQQTGDASA